MSDPQVRLYSRCNNVEGRSLGGLAIARGEFQTEVFRCVTRQNVQVCVEHFLTGHFTVSEKQSDTLATESRALRRCNRLTYFSDLPDLSGGEVRQG